MEEEEVSLLQLGLYTFRLLKRPNGTYRSEPLPLPQEEKGILLVPGEEKTLGVFESVSKPGDTHYVRITPNGTIYCTCWGFRSPNKCWHYRGIVEAIKEGHLSLDNLKEPLIIKGGNRMVKPKSCQHKGCDKDTTVRMGYQMSEFDDWGQEDFYCDEHLSQHIVNGARCHKIRRRKSNPY